MITGNQVEECNVSNPITITNTVYEHDERYYTVTYGKLICLTNTYRSYSCTRLDWNHYGTSLL